MNEIARRGKRLLVISPWESMWSLAGSKMVRAGVSDDYHFVRGFLDAGWELHFLVPDSLEKSTGFESVHRHTYWNFFRATAWMPTWLKRLKWLPWFQLLVVPRALSLARRIRPDVVLGHSHYATLATRMIHRRLGIPGAVKLFGVMDLVHTEWPRWKYVLKNFEQLLAFRHPQDAWIVLDDGTRGNDIIRARGVPESKIHFLPNGVNVEWADRETDRDRSLLKFHLGRPARLVLFLARLVPSKRPDHVVRAIPRVRAECGDVRFVFAGDGPEQAACDALARQLGVADHVHFLGAVPHEDVPDLMAAADVFVSTSNLTNMALPTCEALACGVPTVAYDVGDTQKIVRPRETGLLVPAGDVAALAAAISEVLEDDSLRVAMASSARLLAREVLTSWDERIGMELELLGNLAESRAR